MLAKQRTFLLHEIDMVKAQLFDGMERLKVLYASLETVDMAQRESEKSKGADLQDAPQNIE